MDSHLFLLKVAFIKQEMDRKKGRRRQEEDMQQMAEGLNWGQQNEDCSLCAWSACSTTEQCGAS